MQVHTRPRTRTHKHDTHTHLQTQTHTHTLDTVRDGTTRRTAVLARGERMVTARRPRYTLADCTTTRRWAGLRARARGSVCSRSRRQVRVAHRRQWGVGAATTIPESFVISSPSGGCCRCGRGGSHRARTAVRSFSIPLGLAAGRRPMARRP